MSSIAIITARGGSKRIPRKNIKNFEGKPIIAYSIEAALKSGVFEEVMVSTDDKEIAEIAMKYGASVPFFRSEATSNDFATTSDVIMEVIKEYEKRGKKFDFATCLYPTAPFLTADLIKAAVTQAEKERPDEVIGVVEFSFPPQRCYFVTENGRMEYKYKEFAYTRSQDLEKLYHDAGQLYIYNVEKFIEKNGKLTENLMPYIISPMLVQDIDTEDDWKLAEMKYRFWKESK